MQYSKFFRTHQSILIVDDEDSTVDALSYVLTVEGYDIVAAESGPVALAIMKRKKPDLVICDFMMPEMTGAQLAMEMRADRRTADIPVILCTGAHVNEAERQSGLFSTILKKPIRIADLLLHIKNAMPSLLPGDKTSAIDRTGI